MPVYSGALRSFGDLKSATFPNLNVVIIRLEFYHCSSVYTHSKNVKTIIYLGLGSLVATFKGRAAFSVYQISLCYVYL